MGQPENETIPLNQEIAENRAAPEETLDADQTTATAPDKPKKMKPPKRGENPDEIVKLLKEIEKAEKDVQVAEIELDSRKEAAKSAKAEWMVKVAALRERVRTRERWAEEAKRQPLLQPKKDQKTLPGDVAATTADWRALGINKLGGTVTEKDREKLGAASVYTLGDIQDLMTREGTWWFKKITGVGRAAADRIEAEFNKIVIANTPDAPTETSMNLAKSADGKW